MSATTIEEALKDILRNDAGVSAITTRCFPVKIPQSPTFPLITYTLITDVPENVIDATAKLINARFQIEAWADTYSGSKALAKAIDTALAGYSGTKGTVRVGSILRLTGRDWYEEAVDCYRTIQDFSVWYAI